MDITAIITSIFSSVVASGAIYFLFQEVVKTKLTRSLEAKKSALQGELEVKKSTLQSELEVKKSTLQSELEVKKSTLQSDLEEKKSKWQSELEKNKTNWQGEIQKEVQEYLGEKSAEREYNLEARKRLYTAVGPLRFQLLIACRDAAARIMNYGLSPYEYDMDTNHYYGASTLYRLLRPIAIAELIERQITYADFSVDKTGIDLLRFKKAALIALTDGYSILEHPKADWNAETQHLFSGTLGRLANVLIIQDDDVPIKKRPMHFHEFMNFIQTPGKFAEFSPLKDILHDFDIKKKPIFWIRLVCFGYICNEHIGQAGESIGFQKRDFDLDKLLKTSKDEFTLSNLEKLKEVFNSMLDMSL